VTNSLIDIFLKIILAAILSILMGFERGLRHKGVDLRTHILVGVGSTLIALTSLYLFDIYKDSTTAVDPTRMIAGIVQGIGFLCAGTIIRAGSHVKGLTTAATLWIVSGVGIAVGVGHFEAAILVSVLVFVVLICVRPLEQKLDEKFKNFS